MKVFIKFSHKSVICALVLFAMYAVSPIDCAAQSLRHGLSQLDFDSKAEEEYIRARLSKQKQKNAPQRWSVFLLVQKAI